MRCRHDRRRLEYILRQVCIVNGTAVIPTVTSQFLDWGDQKSNWISEKDPIP